MRANALPVRVFLIFSAFMMATTSTGQVFELPQNIADRFGGAAGVIICKLGDKTETNSSLEWGGDYLDKPSWPCSTFKLPHTAIAIETGALKNFDEVIVWDGVKHWLPAWNKDQTLHSAVKFSVVWFFQETARRIGHQRMTEHVSAFEYGNQSIGTQEQLTTFWLSREEVLMITPRQQIEFLDRLLHKQLPVSDHSYEAVHAVSKIQEGDGWTLHGKTGSSHVIDGVRQGWFIGWVDREAEGIYAFAARIHGDKATWGTRTKKIVIQMLADMKLITK